MIKLKYNTVKTKDNDYEVLGSGLMEGNHDELIAEICAVLNSFEEKCPDLFMAALDNYLKTRGF